MSSIKKREAELVERFIATFEKLGEMRAVKELDPVAWELAFGDPHPRLGHKHWRPIRVDTSSEYLEPIYAKLPARFPPLYERLVLSYRWAEIDLELFTLLANPPGFDLSRLS